MKTLYLRIWLTVVAALALFALAGGWMVQRHLEQERAQFEQRISERMASWAELIENALPEPTAPDSVQAAMLAEWSQRLRLPLALDAADGRRIAASESFERRQAANRGEVPRNAISTRLDDGRTLWLIRPNLDRLLREAAGGHGEPRPPRPDGAAPPPGPNGDGPAGEPPPRMAPPDGRFGPPGPPGESGELTDGPRGGRDDRHPPWWRLILPRDWTAGAALAALLAALFVAVAGGAWPVVRGLTRRLERLRQGVEAFGSGALDQRVTVQGRDEVAALAASFNQAATRIQALVQSHQNLLANASHELRSPLARLKMAVSMLDDAPPAMREKLGREIHTNIAELDELVEEVLLSSRLEAGAPQELDDSIDLAALAAEEAARVQAEVQGAALRVRGSERLLRRALRNLLENARRYGGDDVTLLLAESPDGLLVRVCDRGPGVPQDQRERIFEPFYRLPGHAEREGGVGLGLALVRQIAQAHGGAVRCEPREGGGSCFVITLPASRRL
ncbi:HAMP domain-containing histidine kinase [Ideonella sp. 4Y11]|uniref:histidine kinase n=1 Tax=Ideonella aquatica TaxID=2824119 RepID=A0A941BEB6_9BURK|nr:HAMP domain-containing sensor histidine kinase [Ideonella aquatica]MBQ0957551.1 HAMP domain-containing histidine kinase [Ideonella aquatica]